MGRTKIINWIIAILGACVLVACGQQPDNLEPEIDVVLDEITIRELQAMMQTGELSSVQLLDHYIDRIVEIDPLLNSILEINADAYQIAEILDA